MADNYQAWKINLDDFSHRTSPRERYTFFAQFGILAPSSHNSQPWYFSINDSGITIGIEPSRTIPIGDPENRFSRVSIGCAVANIEAAALHYGFATKVVYNQEADSMRLSFKTGEGISTHPDLAGTILTRVTNRLAYGGQPDADFLLQARSAGTDGLEVGIVDSKEGREEIAHLSVDSSVAAMERSDFRTELSRHVKNNLTRAQTGIPAFGLGMPTPPSLLAPFLVQHFNMSKATKKKDYRTFSSTPVFCLVASKTDSSESQFRAGMCYEKIALMAQQKGMRTAAWGAPIIVEGYYQKLARAFGTTARPQILFRLGYPLAKDPPHSPRIPLDEIVRYTME